MKSWIAAGIGVPLPEKICSEVGTHARRDANRDVAKAIRRTRNSESAQAIQDTFCSWPCLPQTLSSAANHRSNVVSVRNLGCDAALAPAVLPATCARVIPAGHLFCSLAGRLRQTEVLEQVQTAFPRGNDVYVPVAINVGQSLVEPEARLRPLLDDMFFEAVLPRRPFVIADYEPSGDFPC